MANGRTCGVECEAEGHSREYHRVRTAMARIVRDVLDEVDERLSRGRGNAQQQQCLDDALLYLTEVRELFADSIQEQLDGVARELRGCHPYMPFEKIGIGRCLIERLKRDEYRDVP